MWKAYSESYLRQNRTAGLSIMAAALGAAFFLSLLCSLFYNLWAYDVEAIKLDEGSWHVRVEAPLSQEGRVQRSVQRGAQRSVQMEPRPGLMMRK